MSDTDRLSVPASSSAENTSCLHSSCSFSMMLTANA